jgi:DNA-3-methyladenine glycosylase I
LRKRERYREVLYGFDVRSADERRRNRSSMPGIIRNRLKLTPPGAMPRPGWRWKTRWFLWSFVGGEPKINHFKDRSEVPAITPRPLAMSRP